MAGKHQKMYFSFFKIALFVLPIIVQLHNMAQDMAQDITHRHNAQEACHRHATTFGRRIAGCFATHHPAEMRRKTLLRRFMTTVILR